MGSTSLIFPSPSVAFGSSPTTNLFPTKNAILPLRPTSSFSSSSSSSAIHFHDLSFRKRRKRGLVVVGAGPPSTTSYVFAFVFPLSLLAVTIFTSIRIADKLDQDFLEELAVNEEIMEEEDSDLDAIIPLQRETATSHTRNRPKRET